MENVDLKNETPSFGNVLLVLLLILFVHTAYGVTKVLIKDDSMQPNYVPQYCFIFQDEFRQDQLNKVLS